MRAATRVRPSVDLELNALDNSRVENEGASIQRHQILRGIDRSRPDIAPAAWRLVRAGELYSQVYEFVDVAVSHRTGSHPDVRAPLSDPSDIEVLFNDIWGIPEDDLRNLTLLASETLHHIRVALDYSAYFLVWSDTGRRNTSTKFPLVAKPANWSKERRNSVPGLTQSHSSLIRSVQPFNGVAWSAQLVELSNRDKHRVAVDVVPCYGFSFNPSEMYLDPLGTNDHRGFQVEDVEISFRLSDAVGLDPSDAHLELTSTLHGILVGTVDLVNQILGEVGHELITLRPKSEDTDRSERGEAAP